MDIARLISDERQYTLHSHTEFCDGKADMDSMADAAVAAGMRIYGFSPHSPICIPSPCNMKADDVEPYLARVAEIARRHAASGCRFLAGMEIDYLGPEWGPGSEYFRSLPLDYRIGSVHFIPDQSGEYIDIDGNFESFSRKMSEHFRGDIEYVVETFYSQSREMLKAGGFDILGHLDKVGQNAGYYAPGIEDGSHYRALADEFIGLVIDSGITIELNTKARTRHGRFFPGERYLPRLVEAGVNIIVNSDAHTPEGITASRDEAFAILDSLKARK
ncbi:MAG: PHP domain-containing protein [Muribaculaceae bacterium]|nr:PHP domain-containing protein [Muribaculaceae bacterium]